jgi:hypothetical protein
MDRREFLKLSGAGAVAASLSALACEPRGQQARGVSIASDPTDRIAAAPPVRWATEQLQAALRARGIAARAVNRVADAPAGDLCLLVAGSGAAAARQLLGRSRAQVPQAPEALGLVPGAVGGRSALLACGSDVRGAMYAVLELSDRVQLGRPVLPDLGVGSPVVERPANRIRSVQRCFVSAAQDGLWYRDRGFWPDYLSMLATQRFNRLCLALGLGYNGISGITDSYFHFAYPFLVAPPGHDVRAVPLAAGEREANLEMLRFISDEAAARGLELQLGLWNHGYEWIASPNASHTITGLTPAVHPAYCRDSLAAILTACPAITGVTLRVHEEAGVPLGDYQFWQAVLDGIVRAGRSVQVDLHGKHLSDTMIQMALATGMPVTVSPKFWAEHLGLPYQPAAVRGLELPPPGRADDPARPFLRYSYGDLLAENRKYGVLFRAWPGTQRLLLWGDPAMAAACSRAFTFAGSDGAELFEPLSFKGREGSGVVEGGRTAYGDASLEPSRDWRKHAYWYRLWGRLLYDPEAGAEVWDRYLQRQLPGASGPAATALANASRILPLVTAAHTPSASNNLFWPELYTNQPIAISDRDDPYAGDTPAPARFGTVSPLDPELLAGADEFAVALLAGRPTAKHSPIEVAAWLDRFAGTAAHELAAARAASGATPGAELRRWAADIGILSGLGSFFAGKLRAAVLFALFDRSGDRAALDQAVAAYQTARSAWAELANVAQGAYTHDVTFGAAPIERGWWGDRLDAIDRDIAAIRSAVPSGAGSAGSAGVGRALAAVGSPPARPAVRCRHTPPAGFQPGEAMPLRLSVAPDAAAPDAARLHYRHVNQDESYQVAETRSDGGTFSAEIPAAFTSSVWAVQYYFELRRGTGVAWLYPGLDVETWAPPYFVVRQGAGPLPRDVLLPGRV